MSEKVSLRFEYKDGTSQELELEKFTVLNKETDKVVFHLDRLPSGKHLMICAREVMPEGKKLDCIRVIKG